jgi:hypothetical protein
MQRLQLHILVISYPRIYMQSLSQVHEGRIFTPFPETPTRTKSGLTGQCPAGRLCHRMSLIQFFSLLVFYHFSKQICATLCRCLLREQQAGGPLKWRLSPTTVPVREMTNLSFCLDQDGSQERHTVDVEQTHYGLMRKQQG